MKRFALLCLLVVAATLGSMTSLSRAQDPVDILDHYRLLPRLSTMLQTGHEGPDIRYQLLGEYDLRHGLGRNAPASFENSEIWGNIISDFPTPPIVFDIDEILNLDNLSGKVFPVGGPLDLYHFEGSTTDGSTVDLFAATLGPWMYVRGGTEPPPDVADFPMYRVQWLARSRPFADMNDDGVVDTADYVMLRNAGSAGAGVSYADWAQQFGETVPDLSAIDAMMSSAVASVAAATVPEPASASLALLGGVLIAGLRRRMAAAAVWAAARAR